MKKERTSDFENKDRPTTRFKQFGDIFKHRFLELVKLSLLQAIFYMPLFVSLILFYISIRNVTDVNYLMMYFLLQGASLFIAMPFAFIGMTGTYYCIRKMIYMEGEYASSSFFIGVVEEWKKGLVIGLLAGFSSALTVIGFFFFYFYLSQFNQVVTGFGIAILAIQLIVILMVCFYSIGQLVIYSNPLKYVLKNSFIFTLMRFPINLLIFIIHPGIIIALFSIMEITMYVGLGLLFFFATIFHLMWMLNIVASFDKYINQESYPEYYRKGLNKEA